MKSLCSLFLSLSIFLVLVCVGCDSAMQQNEKTDLVFSFRTPNFRSTQSIEDNPTLLIEACLVDYDGKTIQKTEKEISSGEAVSFQFLKIATNINIKVKIQVFVKGDESPSYTGESDWILTQAGANKVSVMLEKVKPSLFEINFNSMGGSEVSPQVLESGVVEKPKNPTKEGYIFDDWYTSSNNGETLESVFDFDTPIEKDLTLYAKWIEIKTSLEVTFPSYDDPEGLISYDEESQTFTAKEGYSSYEWFIDGELQGGNQSFIPDNMTGGIYTVMLIVTTESGDMYSAECQVTITK